MRELFISECEYPSCYNLDESGDCGGPFRPGCVRYAYWDEPQSAGPDDCHYTGLTEVVARAMAENDPECDVAYAVKAADKY